jgi:integrase
VSNQKRKTMATIRYYLRSDKHEAGELQVRYRDGRNIDLKAMSGISVLTSTWNPKKSAFRPGADMELTIKPKKKMDALSDYLRQGMLDLKNEGSTPSVETLKELIDKFHGRAKGKKKETLNEYISRFIEEAENGTRLIQGGKRYANSTCKILKSWYRVFLQYQAEKHPVNFSDITMKFYNDYTGFFTKKNLTPNSIGRYVKHLKAIMRAALEEGLHNNMVVEDKKFKVTKVPVESIYLTEKEINLLFHLDLHSHQELQVARDVFLVGFYTAMRFSDYSRIRKEDYKEYEDGTKVIDLTQKKTGARVVVPVSPALFAILARYDFTLPKTYEQKVNMRIKEVAEKAGITELINTEKIRGGLTVKDTKRKCDLVTTHTARRSGCTNMYLAGIPVLDIMKISGHKTEREFLNYIKVTKEQTASNLARHPYFLRPVMKVEMG